MAIRFLILVVVINVVSAQNWLGSERNDRCGRLLRANDRNAMTTQVKEGLVADVEDTTTRKVLTIIDVDKSKQERGCAPTQSSSECTKNNCYDLRYRTMDGTCNNLDINPAWGAAATQYLRLTSTRYQDGISEIRKTSVRNTTYLPNPRDISKRLLFNNTSPIHDRLNTMVMQWGQFIFHDLVRAAEYRGHQCDGCFITDRCAPITERQGDPHCGSGTCCQSFVRQTPICDTGVGSTPRQQLNEVSSFLDASHIYSISTVDSLQIRDGALLRTYLFEGKTYLGVDDRDRDDCRPNHCDPRFISGDNRVKFFVGLTALQTLVVREHNRVVKELQKLNPQWNNGTERIYQEARKIVGAELQVITYKEWLPKVLGWEASRLLGWYGGYRSNINPSISTEFAFGASLFEHALIPDTFNFTNGRGEPIDVNPGNNGPMMKSMTFHDGMLDPRWMFFNGIDAILRGLTTMPQKYGRLGYQVTEQAFRDDDLGATDIQTGRDVGLGTYNDAREFCRLRRAYKFDDFATEIKNKNVLKNLSLAYIEPDDVDFFVGALLEDPVQGGVVGPTIACILADQFKRLRDGDRFWYQNEAVFTWDQRSQLDRVTFARLFCDNSDNLETIPSDAFNREKGIPCQSVSTWNLTPWTETPVTTTTTTTSTTSTSTTSSSTSSSSSTSTTTTRRPGK